MRPGRVLLFFATVITALAAVGRCFPADGIDFGSRHIGFASLHSLVESSEPPAPVIVEPRESPELAQLRDSVNYYRSLVNDGDLRFWLPSPHYFDAFWRSAEDARSTGRIVRILHYGDSQIEMDHLTSRLRVYMQRTFGGGGPGMVPFHTITPSFTISQSTSGHLTHLASFGDSTVVRSRGDYGPMMQCFRLGGGYASTTLRASKSKNTDERAKHFSRVSLVYNNRGIRLSSELADRTSKTRQSQTADSGIGSLVWDLDSASNNIRLGISGKADLYCVLLDDGPGVAVDNIPMRGCSGQQFTLVPEEKLAAAYSQMDVGLILLQFGGNNVPYLKTEKQISTYCRNIGRQIDHVRRCCPRAKILFIGPSDMSIRLRGKLQTYPVIPQLVDSLAATALAHGVAYWSIYHAMGGLNTMPQWTRQGLAGQDYIHFSQRGADLMGDRLAEALDNNYTLYRMERKMRKREKNR